MSLSPAARLLGYAGLLPQLAAFLLILAGGGAYRFAGQALAFAYASLIFSFLGGAWWGLAARGGAASGWPYGLAVLPSLMALAAALPWALAWPWPGPSLILLGVAIALSPVIDRAFVAAGLAPQGWMALRVPLSLGLGGLTLLAGLLAF